MKLKYRVVLVAFIAINVVLWSSLLTVLNRDTPATEAVPTLMELTAAQPMIEQVAPPLTTSETEPDVTTESVEAEVESVIEPIADVPQPVKVAVIPTETVVDTQPESAAPVTQNQPTVRVLSSKTVYDADQMAKDTGDNLGPLEEPADNGTCPDNIGATEVKLKANEPVESGFFGHYVDMWENRLIVGNDRGNNTAYIYTWNGQAWANEVKLTKPGGGYGGEVAIQGDWAAVGARNENDNKGAVYVYHLENSTWVETARLTSDPNDSGKAFGRGLAFLGDRLIVGVDGGIYAYIFKWDGNQWTQETKITGHDTVSGDDFGSPIDTWGDRIVIGAVSHSHSGQNYAGAAYVFKNYGTDANSDWREEAKLTASNPGYGDHFAPVAIWDNHIIAGAGGDFASGANTAYAFQWDGSEWKEIQQLKPGYVVAGDQFGQPSLWKDWLVVGATGHSSNRPGYAYLFHWNGTIWEEITRISAMDGHTDNWYGIRVVISEDRIVIGASRDSETATDSGAVYTYRFDYDGNWAPDIDPIPDQISYVDQPVTPLTITATDCNGDAVTISIDPATLPPGLGPTQGLSPLTISGIPTIPGVYTVKVAANDGKSPSEVTTSFTWTILDAAPDSDGDGMPDASDNCPAVANPDQTDTDQDGIGDVCDPLTDSDNDGIADDVDNCPINANPEQTDTDQDGIGDVCDPLTDSDNDGIADDVDNCPINANPEQTDTDQDGIGDVCDPLTDSDNDGIADDVDNCPIDANPEQTDTDQDGIGDVCDPLTDSDNDGIADDVDNCPINANPEQTDTDQDGIGDICDPLTDSDNDGIADDIDNCVNTPNPDQLDSDNDGIGDVCDDTPYVCVPDPANDLKHAGSFINRPDFSSGTIQNLSNACAYEVGMASYQMVDNTTDNQILFNYQTVTIQPGTIIMLQVALPSCATQVDLFYGNLILDFVPGLRYGDRLIDGDYILWGEWCTQETGENLNDSPAPVVEEPIDDSPQDTDTEVTEPEVEVTAEP